MILDGISASEHVDSSGEILKVKGHEISDLEEGKGVLNWEHNNDSSQDIIGSIVFAKKIMKREDCSNKRERMYWDSCKVPMVYIKAELFDGEEHPGAVAAAAIVRYYHNRGEKVLAGFSIEGATLQRGEDSNILERTVGRRVALTLRPCNKSAISGVLEDKSISDIVKKTMKTDVPEGVTLVEVDSVIFEDIAKSESDPFVDLKTALTALKKTLTAGGHNVAPSQLQGGSALVPEHNISKRKLKNSYRAAARDWNKKRPFTEFAKTFIKAAMPEVSDEYVEHFVDVAQDISLKKAEGTGLQQAQELHRVDKHHSFNKNASPEQDNLLTGLYLDPSKKFEGLDKGFTGGEKLQLQNDAGQQVLVKTPSNMVDLRHDASLAGTDYYHLADKFFGLGKHVPVTNHFDHPTLGSDHPHSTQAMEIKEGAISSWSPAAEPHLAKARDNGTLHKLAIMDTITNGHTDRHSGNFIISAEGDIQHIDNDDAFQYNAPYNAPADYMMNNAGIGPIGGATNPPLNDFIHPNASIWLKNLDPKHMAVTMKKQDMDDDVIKQAVTRLKLTQQAAASGTITMKQLHEITTGKKIREGLDT